MKRTWLIVIGLIHSIICSSQIDSTAWEVEIISPTPILQTSCGFLAENPDLRSKIDSINLLIHTEADSAMLVEFELDEEIWKEYEASQRNIFIQSRLDHNELMTLVRSLMVSRICYLELYYKFIIHRGWH